MEDGEKIDIKDDVLVSLHGRFVGGQVKTEVEEKEAEDLSNELCVFPCYECAEPFSTEASLKHHLNTFHHHSKCSKNESQETVSVLSSLKGEGEDIPASAGSSMTSYNDRDSIPIRRQEMFDDPRHNLSYHPAAGNSLTSFDDGMTCSGDRDLDIESDYDSTSIMDGGELDKADGSGLDKIAYDCLASYHKAFSATGSSHDDKEQMLTRDGGRTFECGVCSKVFSTKSNLKAHMMIHSGEKPFECTECNRSFSRKEHLTKHIRTHTGEQPYECPVCGKRFSQNGTLSTHVKIHNEDKSFECSVCGKKFSHKVYLVGHIRIHNGEKPYECNVCGKCFAQRCSLNKHMMIHNGEKPFKCGVCSKIFSLKCNLSTHMRIHKGEKPYECSVCGKSFTRNDKLKKHMTIHMKDKSR